MSAKAKECVKCHYFPNIYEMEILKGNCWAGHKPRFYYDEINPSKCVYKRRCDDFKAKEPWE